jgi:hypothetical protein
MRLLIRLNAVEVYETVACPKCGARIGEECFEGAASRDANHIERYRIANKQYYDLIQNALAAYREAVER